MDNWCAYGKSNVNYPGDTNMTVAYGQLERPEFLLNLSLKYCS